MATANIAFRGGCKTVTVAHRAYITPTYIDLKRGLRPVDQRILESVVERGAWGPDEVKRLVVEERWPQREAYARVREALKRGLFALRPR